MNPWDRIQANKAYEAMTYPDYPIEQFQPGVHAIATEDGTGEYFTTQEAFFRRCAEYGQNPLDLKPVLAKWNDATIDADDILGAIEDQLPDEDLGSDPIHEKAVCQAAAEAAQAVIKAANLGSYHPLKKKPFIPDAWREMYAPGVTAVD